MAVFCLTCHVVRQSSVRFPSPHVSSQRTCQPPPPLLIIGCLHNAIVAAVGRATDCKDAIKRALLLLCISALCILPSVNEQANIHPDMSFISTMPQYFHWLQHFRDVELLCVFRCSMQVNSGMQVVNGQPQQGYAPQANQPPFAPALRPATPFQQFGHPPPPSGSVATVCTHPAA